MLPSFHKKYSTNAMQIIKSTKEMQSQAIGLRMQGRIIGLVPTMGALHEGHMALVKQARERCDIVIVSVFVNPTQFGPNEDFEEYPRTLEDDAKKCEDLGADIVFAPSTSSIYPQDFSTFIYEEKLSKGLCGISRPGHFRGVCTVVTKLYNLCRPDMAFFGQKDAQQTAIIKRMTHNLNFNIEAVVVPTVREPDGLAMSSRNAYLTPPQREEALKIYKALRAGKELTEQGIRQTDRIEAEVTHSLTTGRRLRVIYVSIVDRDSLEPVRQVTPGKTLLAVACWVDEVRLIDNIIL